MPFSPSFFRPKAGYFGAQLVSTSCIIGTGGTSIADTATTAYLLPKPSCTTCQLVSVSMGVSIAAVSAGQTVTVQVFKRDQSGTPADRTLTGTKSVMAALVTVLQKAYAIALTSTSVQNLTFQSTDTCRVDAVASGAVSTQPTMYVNATWAIVQP